MFINKDNIKTVTIVGTGTIGAGWANRLLHRGINVIATDPGVNAEDAIRESIEKTEPVMNELFHVDKEKRGQFSFISDLKEAVSQADFIQENAPEREELKTNLLAEISKHSKPNAVIASSSSNLLPTVIQAKCINPERVIIGHPFNPVYLVPLVELLGGEKTSEEAIKTATEFYEMIGMHPLRVRKEIDGYIGNRLQEALWREAMHLINEGAATTDEIDQAIIYGPGLRWSFIGTCMTYALCGGDAGFRHMLEQFGPTFDLPLSKLKAPELTGELIDRLVDGTDKQLEGYTTSQVAEIRDRCLVSVIKSLGETDYAAGKTFNMDIMTQKERNLI